MIHVAVDGLESEKQQQFKPHQGETHGRHRKAAGASPRRRRHTPAAER